MKACGFGHDTISCGNKRAERLRFREGVAYGRLVTVLPPCAALLGAHCEAEKVGRDGRVGVATGDRDSCAKALAQPSVAVVSCQAHQPR